MNLRDLKLFCIQVLQCLGPERVPLAGRILADISFYEIFKRIDLTQAETKELKHHLKVVLAKYGSSDTRKLSPDDAKIETCVTQFIRTDDLTSKDLPETFTFYKEEYGWYIDLPEFIEWGGSKGDLEMVSGADSMLDLIAGNGKQVTLKMDTVHFDDADVLELVQLRDPLTGGGDYLLKNFEGKEINQQMWLCGVTEFVFGFMPEKIFIKRSV